MATCYQCGVYIQNGTGYRRKVFTGDSHRIYFGKRISGSYGTYYGIRTLCGQCTEAHDKRERIKAIGFIVGIIVLVWVLFFSQPSKNTRVSESSYGPTSPMSGQVQRSTSSSSVPPAVGYYWYVNTVNLNLRQDPGVNQPVLQALPMNTRVVIMGEQKKIGDSIWAKIKTVDGNIQEGWVNQAFLRKSSSISP